MTVYESEKKNQENKGVKSNTRRFSRCTKIINYREIRRINSTFNVYK